jgi:hypothetical protein
LSKEFKDFFENPPDESGEPRGFFLLAAMGTLTQKG